MLVLRSEGLFKMATAAATATATGTAATATAALDLEQGWAILQNGIVRIIHIVEGHRELEFSSSDYMSLFTVAYNMCTRRAPHDYSQQLYDGYVLAIKEYLLQKVLPSLREKRGERLLEEFVRRWTNHKVLVSRLSEIFHYLDRYFVQRKGYPPLRDMGKSIFRDLVYHEMKNTVRDCVIVMVNNERDGVQINKHLIKGVVSVFLEIEAGRMDLYDNDFEAAFLENTFHYYLQKARCWLMMDSCTSDMQSLRITESLQEKDEWVLVEPVDFKQKMQECVYFERNNVLFYLHSNTEKKLVEKVEAALLSMREHFPQ